MKITTLFLIFALTLIAGAAAAQQQTILLPVAPDLVGGGFGSVWETQLAITNTGQRPVTVFGYAPSRCPFDPCNSTPPPIPPQATIFTGIISERCIGLAGRLLTVNDADAGQLAFTLRTHDTSRDEKSWGTVVPVVKRSSLYADRFSIVDVPVDPRFRATLRIYDADASTPPAVNVRYFAEDPATPYPVAHSDVLISETRPAFGLPPSSDVVHCPGYAQVSLATDPALVAAGRLRIEIDPLDGRRDYWAFVSVTNNDTQEVTAIAPQ